jgi:hypothetical protein
MVGRVCPRHGHRGRPLNSVVRCQVTAPFQCVKCGTGFSPGALPKVDASGRESRCTVCGDALEEIPAASVAQSPKADTLWLWLAAFSGEMIAWLVLVLFAATGIFIWR